MWYDVLSHLFVSVILGGAVGLTLQQLGYDEDISFNPRAVAGIRVLITGASSGIGEQVAYQYAQHGARVVLTARREEQLKQVAEKCRQMGAPQASYITADLTRVMDAERVVHMASEALGGLDHVIMGHAYFPSINAWTGSGRDLADVQVVYDVNVKSYIHLATHALPHLAMTNGSLGIVSSLEAKLYVPYRTLYTMSKHALDGFFSSLRAELSARSLNVSVTFCVLGAIDTARRRAELEAARGTLTAAQLTAAYTQLASPQDAGHVVVEAVSTRRREVFYPPAHGLKLRIVLGELFPSYSHISFAFPAVESNQ